MAEKSSSSVRNGKLEIIPLVKQVKAFFAELLGQPCRILGVVQGDGRWEVTCEITVDSEYTTRKGIGDIVEIYEVHANENMEIIEFVLMKTKKKATVDE